MTIVQNIQADAVETTHGFSNYGGRRGRPSLPKRTKSSQGAWDTQKYYLRSLQGSFLHTRR